MNRKHGKIVENATATDSEQATDIGGKSRPRQLVFAVPPVYCKIDTRWSLHERAAFQETIVRGASKRRPMLFRAKCIPPNARNSTSINAHRRDLLFPPPLPSSPREFHPRTVGIYRTRVQGWSRRDDSDGYDLCARAYVTRDTWHGIIARPSLIQWRSCNLC